MITKYVMFYKTFHTDKYPEIRYFDTWQRALEAADTMIEQFKFWGGGSVPIKVEAVRWTKAGKYKDTPMSKDYPASDYITYARENSNKCGYLQLTH